MKGKRTVIASIEPFYFFHVKYCNYHAGYIQYISVFVMAWPKRIPFFICLFYDTILWQKAPRDLPEKLAI